MGNAVLADPHGQKRISIEGVRLNDAFNNALDTDTISSWPEPRRPEEIGNVILRLADAWIAEREVQAFDDALRVETNSSSEQHKRKHEDAEWDVAPRQVKFPRINQRNEDLRSENAFWQGQTPSAAGVRNNGADNISPHNEITPGRGLSQELARRVAVAEPGSQTPGVAVNGVALRLPQVILPSDDQGATASGSHPRRILNEVSAGTKLLAACQALYCICYGL
jgi:hypothetical protein